MNKVSITLAKRKYEVWLAKTQKEKADGLQGIKELPEDGGMLFLFDPPQDVNFWMDKTLIPLYLVFFDDDQKVIRAQLGQPLDKTLIPCSKVAYVLEINAPKEDIKKGEEFEFNEKMRVLDPNGDTQMELYGGERIFSRENTKTLIRMAKRAKVSKDDTDYKKLGNKIFAFIEKQDNNKPEYVEKKDDKS